jgi:GntR family transcriptional regulator, transcriptional repressor for pyruvate dehydrogenase complex
MTERAQFQSRRPVYQDVREHIQDLIRKGDLRVGDKLPPERKLAETFDVSRNSVREAIRVLTENNIVQSRQGDGTYVCAADDGSLMNSFARALGNKRRRVREIFEFRRILEPQIAFLAASNITRNEIDRLKVLTFDQERRIVSGEEDSDLDAAFHLSLARATRNSVIVQVLRSLNDVLSETRSDGLQSEERRTASLRTHILIVDALEKRDPEATKQAMKAHLLEVEQAVFGAGKDT